MRGMESIAKNAGIPVYINNGHWDRNFSMFYGKLEKKGMNKQDAIQKFKIYFKLTMASYMFKNKK